MAQTDRTLGLIGDAGIKLPCRVATTANITLSGQQTIDGVAVVTDDRVLVKNQTSSIDNGIYIADTGSWSRAKDCDGAYDLVTGSLIKVNFGTAGSGFWYCSSVDPIVAGTSALTFIASSTILAVVSVYAQTLLDDTTAAIARNTLGLSNQRLWCGTATGSANALTLTPTVAAEALVAGLEVVFKSSAAGNSAATTIAVSGLAATAAQSNGTAMVGGEIQASKWYRGTYDGAAFQVERVAAAMLLEMLTTKGDIVVATGDQAASRLAVGAAGTVPMSRAAATAGLAYVAPFPSLIYGNTYSNNVADATNDIDIALGGCMDSTGAYWMTGAAITKQLDAAWAVGSAAGGLDTGAIGNSDYYIWRIVRSDTGVVDVLFSLSPTAPTMPANYDFKRLIGWMKRVGGTIVAFHTYETDGGGIELLWNVPTLDINLSNTLTTARRTDPVKVPLDFSVTAQLNVAVGDGAAGFDVWICCPDQTDAAPSITATPLSNVGKPDLAGTAIAQMRVRTDATGKIAARASLATVDAYNVSTMGFVWSRR